MPPSACDPIIFLVPLLGIRPGKTDPRPETRTEQPESIPEPTSEMQTTGFDPNTQSNPTHNRTEPKIEHDPK